MRLARGSGPGEAWPERRHGVGVLGSENSVTAGTVATVRFEVIPRPRFAPPVPVAGARGGLEEAAEGSRYERAAVSAAVFARVVDEHPGGVAVAELARALDFPRPAVESALRRLSVAGFVRVSGSEVALDSPPTDDPSCWPYGWRNDD